MAHPEKDEPEMGFVTDNDIWDGMTDEDAKKGFAMPWQEKNEYRDDPTLPANSLSEMSFAQLQGAIWDLFNQNPQVFSSVIDRMGRITGDGFETTCSVQEIHKYVKKIESDPRNRLYNFWPKYVGRSEVEGELFLTQYVHEDGFVEVDFRDPGTVESILRDPEKPQMPLGYKFTSKSDVIGSKKEIIPSIFVAYYPGLAAKLRAHKEFDKDLVRDSKGRGDKYKKLGGFSRFVVQWDKSLLTDRAVSYLRTILRWANHYENLKQYEIDHKKSSGSYLWVAKFLDIKAWKTWVMLTDDERKTTGIMEKKSPGMTLLLPPGLELECKNPTLPKISDADTDIMHMVTAGLNAPEDMVTGESGGTFASVKASRGPQSDRISDETCNFERFLRYDFWRGVFFLATAMGKLKPIYQMREAVDYKGKKPVYEMVDYEPHELLEINFPTSEVSDLESRSRAMMGVKHGGLPDTMGVSRETVAKKLGIRNYRRQRLMYDTENDKYPELAPPIDQETVQEDKLEPSKTGTKGEKPAPAKNKEGAAPKK